ncbi:MAG: leucine-rich repeat domain-containing protein [Clostridiales bacterium]|nr:leucine-rich repeat domain-containing protein [Clostridiales bacterium]
MKKTVLTFILSVLAVFACAFAFVACGGDGSHKHSAQYYSVDENTHWKVCDECGKTFDNGEHSLNASGVCSVCGYIAVYTHGLEYDEVKDDNENVIAFAVIGKGEVASTDIIIPSYHNGKPVTDIWNEAFAGCSDLTSIVIPDSVTYIGRDAFENTAYYNDESNWENEVLYIGKHLIEARNTLSGAYAIKQGTLMIADDAFLDCSDLTSIEIPNSATSIGWSAFNFCSSLASITVQNGNTKYHSGGNCLIDTTTKTLIQGCNNSIIPTDGSVTSIEYGAFWGCSSLTSIEIPNSVTSIGDRAFAECSSLTSIEISNSVTSIEKYAFSGCSSLTSIEIPNSVTSIRRSAFWGCSSLTSITIGNGVTSIGDSAFYGCSSLTSIEIPNSVTSIDDIAFISCINLTSIKFNGTMAQWAAISKGSSWNYNTGDYTVTCTDGTLSKSESE